MGLFCVLLVLVQRGQLLRLNPRVDGAFLCPVGIISIKGSMCLNPRVDGAFLCLQSCRDLPAFKVSQSPC